MVTNSLSSSDFLHFCSNFHTEADFTLFYKTNFFNRRFFTRSPCLQLSNNRQTVTHTSSIGFSLAYIPLPLSIDQVHMFEFKFEHIAEIAFFIGYALVDNEAPNKIVTQCEDVLETVRLLCLGETFAVFNCGLNNCGFLWHYGASGHKYNPNCYDNFVKVDTPSEKWVSSIRLWKDNDVIAMLVDLKKKELRFYKNNEFMYSAPSKYLKMPNEKESVYACMTCNYHGDCITILPFRKILENML